MCAHNLNFASKLSKVLGLHP